MPSQQSDDQTQLKFEGFTLDPQRHGLYRGVERIHLTPTPYKVLFYLARNAGHIISKENLLEAVWGEHRDENTVEQAVRQVRRALGAEKEHARIIQTIPGEGYCFIAQIAECDPPHSDTEDLLPKSVDEVRENTAAPNRSKRRIAWIAGFAVVGSVLVGLALRQTESDLIALNPTKITRSHSRILSPLMEDGVHILYPQYENGRFGLAAVPKGGGESVNVVTSITSPELCDLDPTGGKMLLRELIRSRDEDEPLFVQQINGPAQNVGGVLAYDASWYPDSRHILFSSDGVVYKTDMNGESRQRLFQVPGNAFWFRWSHDGTKVRFTVIDKRSEETSLWEASADGEGVRRLFQELHEHVCCGTWTPDERYFLFQVRVENRFQVWAQRDEHSYLLPVRSKPFPLVYGATSYRGPLPSRDGKKVFARAEVPNAELVRYDVRSAQFISVLPSLSIRTMEFSNDARWIAYTSLADNNLWRCRADGTQCSQLTQDFKNTVMPRWSPDGQTIAFMGLTFTGKWAIFTVPAKGGEIHTLSHDNQAKGYPDWSRDGERVAFSDVPPVSQPKGIYILDIRSEQVSTLPGSSDFFFPRWSPDGRFLLAQHSGDLHLYLFESATGKWTPLTNVAVNYPHWSHDGKYVYFAPYGANDRGIFRVAIANRVVEEVTSLAGVERGPFFMGDWIGLAPDDSPLAVRNMTIEDIYAWDLVPH